jgi:hypothetical protein
MGNKDAPKPQQNTTVEIKTVPDAEARATAPNIKIVESIDRLTEFIKETRRGVVVAIAATFSTAVALSLEPWIGLGGVILFISVTVVFVAVILLYIFKLYIFAQRPPRSR